MKKMRLLLPLAGLLALCCAGGAFAADKTKDEKKAESAAASLDKAAARPEGQATVTDRLKAEFKVDDARIQGLRDQGLGYGEIGIALSLASQLPGGIDDANVQKVMVMRQGPPVQGWGKIAKDLGLKLGKAVSQVKRTEAAVRRQERARQGQGGGTGAKERMQHQQRMRHEERVEREERTENREGMGRPEGAGKGGR